MTNPSDIDGPFSGKLGDIPVSGTISFHPDKKSWEGSVSIPSDSVAGFKIGSLYRLDLDNGFSVNVRMHKVIRSGHSVFVSNGPPLAG